MTHVIRNGYPNNFLPYLPINLRMATRKMLVFSPSMIRSLPNIEWLDYPNLLGTVFFCMTSSTLCTRSLILKMGFYIRLPDILNPPSLVCLFAFLSLLLCHHKSLHLTGKSWCIERWHWVSWAVRVWENWRGRVLVSSQGQGWHSRAKFSWGRAGLCNKKSIFWSSLS